MATAQTRDHRRFRLAGNDNEIVVDASSDNVMEPDTEGHRLATNHNEIVVE